MTVYTLPGDWNHETKDALCEWLKANGVDPKVVPQRSEIEVADGVINYYERSHPYAVWVGRSVPLISPMPDALAAQCRLPQTLCPHCGADINALPEAVSR